MAHNKYDCCAARSAYQRCQVISDEGLISRTSPFNSFLPESYFHNRAIMATRLMVQVWLDDCSWRRCLVELCIARLHCSSGPNGALSNFDDTRIDGINFGTQEVWASLLYGGAELDVRWLCASDLSKPAVKPSNTHGTSERTRASDEPHPCSFR